MIIRTVIAKEIRDILGSSRFAVTFAVCAVLIVLSFFLGARGYQQNLSRFEAARAENLRQMEGLTSWLEVRHNRIFLPPTPLESLVKGVSDDIGRTVEVRGRGELIPEGSRFNEEPILATFRFLDLEFIFQVVLSLLAILFAFDAVSGEKERGTLRLALSGSFRRHEFLMGKIGGAFIALSVPLLLAILLGCLLMTFMGVHLSGTEWLRLGLIILLGLLYFGAFVALAVCVSSLTRSSAQSFLVLLALWVLAVVVIPRGAVLVSGRLVDVPSVDLISSQKARYAAQLWREDRARLDEFDAGGSTDMMETMNRFNKMMGEMADARERKMRALTDRLNEERRNRQAVQIRLALGLARSSPATVFSLASSTLSGTSLELEQEFYRQVQEYQQAYAAFITEKTGMNPGGVVVRIRSGDEEDEEETINPHEIPAFTFRPPGLPRVLGDVLPDAGLLLCFNILFVAGAFFAFMRYDPR